MSSVRVACCQISPDVERPDRSAELARDAIRAAIAEGAQIVVLPELANSGYVLRSVQEARAAGASEDGELLAGWASEAARGDALVIGGFCELTPDGTLFNSAALVDGTGVLAVYRKLHLWGEEPRWFAAGSHPAPVVKTRHRGDRTRSLLRPRVPGADARARTGGRRADRRAHQLAARARPAGRPPGRALARRHDRLLEQGVRRRL